MLIIVLFLLFLLFNKTKIGLAMRAVANNQESSNLVGIRVGLILILGWGLSGSIAVLAASMLAPSAGLTGSLMLGPFLLASVAAVLGGLDSPVGAVDRWPDHRPRRGVPRSATGHPSARSRSLLTCCTR